MAGPQSNNVGTSTDDPRQRIAAAKLRTQQLRTFVYTIPYTLAAGSTGTARIPIPFDCYVDYCVATVNTAPTGASVVLDVKKNGVTLYTTSANRPTIAANAFASPVAYPNVTQCLKGDYLTADVISVGSTIAGADAVLMVVFK